MKKIPLCFHVRGHVAARHTGGSVLTSGEDEPVVVGESGADDALEAKTLKVNRTNSLPSR